MTGNSRHSLVLRPDKHMNQYELLYIVGSQFTDAEVGKIQAAVAALLEKNGAQILRNDMVGKIKMAYSIKKVRHGSYVLVHFDAPTNVIKDVNRQLELMDEVLRHTLLIRVPGAENKKVELTAYVPPLSDEGKKTESRSPTPVREKIAQETDVTIAPEIKTAPREELNMSMEELDKKLDEILEDDLSEKV